MPHLHREYGCTSVNTTTSSAAAPDYGRDWLGLSSGASPRTAKYTSKRYAVVRKQSLPGPILSMSPTKLWTATHPPSFPTEGAPNAGVGEQSAADSPTLGSVCVPYAAASAAPARCPLTGNAGKMLYQLASVTSSRQTFLPSHSCAVRKYPCTRDLGRRLK